MRHHAIYRILKIGLKLAIVATASCALATAQQMPKTPVEADLYCSAVTTTQAVPSDTYLISGENSDYKITFSQGENVYLNRGSASGVKVGDEFEVVRPVHDIGRVQWFKWQDQLAHAMGTTYADIGRVRVVSVQAKTSIAEVKLTCDMMQRGDLVRPFTARPIPAFHNVQFDPFAAPSGKKTAMVVTKKNFGLESGNSELVLVNLGTAQGVHIGDYFRVFRYQGSRNELAYKPRDTAFKVYGFGSTPVAYQWNNVPRQVLGEGIVLRTGPNSSTVMLTTVRLEIYDGDYVEIE